ncbi:AprI/Inh family metalloprotease inhibitor [Sphingomonas sp. MMS12-HWE2-04]|uniref:AprI/Inh family metalloprotease inhibitor n=1 Tax=Sphingomonas sp. MMS12-HWE2-04 TaxID=3234199 RepID=UPI00384A6A43
MRHGLLLAAALVAPLPASAQIDHEIIDAMVGPWTLLPTDGRPGCSIEFRRDRIGGAMRALLGATCKLTIPAAARVTGWKLDDGDTLLVDTKGAVQIRFVEDETALLSSPDLIAPQYYLIPRVSGYDHLPQARELVGSWQIAQRGKHACQITLGQVTQTPDGTTGPVKASPSCGAGSIPARLTSWSREDLKIMLWGPNDLLLAFEPTGTTAYVADPGTWSLSR